MLITESHIIPCQPKTRSSLRRQSLAPLICATTGVQTKDRHYGGHVPAHELPASIVGDRQFVAVVRDPLEWYRSVYRHCLGPYLHGKVQRGFEHWGRGFHDWRSVVYGWTHPTEVEPPPWSDSLYCPGGLHAPEYFGRGGMWSWSTRYHNGLGASLALPSAIVRCEEMGAGFEAAGVCQASIVDGLQPVNVSRYDKDAVTPIDDEIRQWVSDADGELAAQCGY